MPRRRGRQQEFAKCPRRSQFRQCSPASCWRRRSHWPLLKSKTGEIKSTDATKHEIVLSSGDTFELGSKVKIDKLKVGEKVTVTYEMKDGKMLASKVHAAK